MTQSNSEYCQDLVQKEDRARYQHSLFASESQRQQLMTIYAFQLELAEIRKKTNETMLGEIRLQWWREAIDGILNDQVRGHPVVAALSEIDNFTDLAPHLMQMIDARSYEISEADFHTMDSVNEYAAGVGGAFAVAILKLLRPNQGDDTEQLVAIASQIGESDARIRLATELYLESVSRSKSDSQMPENHLSRIEMLLAEMLQLTKTKLSFSDDQAQICKQLPAPVMLMAKDSLRELEALQKTDGKIANNAKYKQAGPFRSLLGYFWTVFRKKI